tara:strand:- start:1352 stop:1504 length:153 start_codon:yes stop_codon:yes gene_type:complete
MTSKVLKIIGWILALLVVIVIMRFAFKLGFIVLIFGVGFFLGYRYKTNKK